MSNQRQPWEGVSHSLCQNLLMQTSADLHKILNLLFTCFNKFVLNLQCIYTPYSTWNTLNLIVSSNCFPGVVVRLSFEGVE